MPHFPGGLFIVTISILAVFCEDRKQFVKIFAKSRSSSCAEDLLSETITGTEGTWISDRPKNSTVVIIVNGLWKINGELHSGFGDECKSIQIQRRQNVTFSRFGDEGQMLEGIRCYSSPDLGAFMGMIRGNFTEWAWGPAGPREIRSYYFIGNGSWAFYSEEDYEGTELCLRPNDSTVEHGYGFTFDRDILMGFSVRSVRQSCREDDDEEETTEEETTVDITEEWTTPTFPTTTPKSAGNGMRNYAILNISIIVLSLIRI